MNTSVLVVDDSSFIVEGLVSILKRHSYRPLSAHSGDECLKILEMEIPDIIILDILMEPMDGWETLARIRQNSRTHRVPVLIFSAKKLSIKDAETYRISIDDFIAKPIVPTTLLSAIDRVLSRQVEDRRLMDYWKSEGVPDDRIDAYFSVKTELMIDTQLNAVLQRQVDLCSGDDVCRLELGQALSAITQRIRKARLHLEEISRELPRPNNTEEDIAQKGIGKEREESAEEKNLKPPAHVAPNAGPPADHPYVQGKTTGTGHTDPVISGNSSEEDTIADHTIALLPAPEPAPIPIDPGFTGSTDPAELKDLGEDWHPVFYNIEPEQDQPGNPPDTAQITMYGLEHPLPYRHHPITEETPGFAPPHIGLGETGKVHDPYFSFEPAEKISQATIQQERAEPLQKGSFFGRLVTSILSLFKRMRLKR